jgi:threonyl-tRNA synthetase
MESGQVSVRDRIDGDLGAMSVEAAITKLQQEVAERTVRQSFASDAGLGERGSRNEY